MATPSCRKIPQLHNSSMQLTELKKFAETKKIALAGVIAILLIAGIMLAWSVFRGPTSDSARQQLLEFIPPNSAAVIFVDLDKFKQSPFLGKIYEWLPHSAEDSEYAQFVRDTGFSYERDLKQVVMAISNRGAGTDVVAVADGKFDRKKIEQFLSRNRSAVQQGKWRVLPLEATVHDKPLALAFISDNRIVITNAENVAGVLSASAAQAGHVEWNSRFDRLAGTPLFAVIRQDGGMQNAFNSVAPGGFGSPQLSALLDQLQWISIAGKPEGDQLRIVGEGECLSSQSISQLHDILEGILILAQNGLNDPKLRQQMNPDEHDAYVEILKSADVQKIDRGEWKSVRAVLSITPKFLDVVRSSSANARKAEVTPAPKQTAAPVKPKTRKKK